MDGTQIKTTQGKAAQGDVTRSLWLIIALGCVISALTFGVRSSFGLFTDPLSATHGWDREVFALAFAIQNLAWGIGQPLAGPIIDRYGPARVLAIGGALYAAGLALMAYADDPLSLHVTVGVMVGFGMGGASYITVLAAFSRIVPKEKRSWALGIGAAAGSFGQFALAPFTQGLIATYDWRAAVLALAGLMAVVPIMALVFRGSSGAGDAAAAIERDLGFVQTLKRASRHTSYVLLVLGFFVCGFQLAFITVHLPPYLADQGISAATAGWGIAFIGLFNVIGAYGAGIVGGRYPKPQVLTFIYLGRAAAIAAFITLPLSFGSVLVFSAVMGVLWLSTVPPTSGLVADMFGTRYMATLFGIVFFSHQIGSFMGAWLGGALHVQTGSYDLVWWLSVVLAVIAAVMHWPIKERLAPGFGQAVPRS